MPTINVTDEHAVQTICPSCASYFHRFLDHSPRCGWARVAAYMPLMPDPLPRIDGPLPGTRGALATWLAAHAVPRDVASTRIEEAAKFDEREPLVDQDCGATGTVTAEVLSAGGDFVITLTR